MSPRSPM